jgi:hypothetical protein
VARCPHLGLEEYGTTPFPFPSPSHHCYLTTPGLPVGQREQQRYCLSKRYKGCPLYVSQFGQETVAASLPETIPASLEAPLREPVQGRVTDEETSDKPPRVAGPPTAAEPAVQAGTTEETEPSATQSRWLRSLLWPGRVQASPSQQRTEPQTRMSSQRAWNRPNTPYLESYRSNKPLPPERTMT